jgi:hypothetical protein
MSMLALPIARRSCPERETFLRQFASTRTPVVITDAMTGWRALSQWSLEFFGDRYGSLRVPVQVWTSRKHDEMRSEHMELRQYVQRLRAPETGTTYYLGNFDFLAHAPELADDIARPPYLDRRETDAPLFFLAPAGAVTPLHYDRGDNFVAQTQGRKRFILIAPRYGSFLYHPSFRSRYYWASPVDAEAPDFSRYPRLSRVQMHECILEPGEMLFIPGGWRHQVRALEQGISLSFFFTRGLRRRLTRRVLAWMGRPGV